MFRDRDWDPIYTTDDGSLTEQFYIPVLSMAVRYDRGAGFFSAGSLVRNMRGIEMLIHNGGKMRLLVGYVLGKKEVEAIRRGEDLKKQVRKNLCEISLDPSDTATKDGLELLAWMIAADRLEIKVAIRCNAAGMPVNDESMYHKKTGVARDRVGNSISWSGSDNETYHGQTANSELLSVFTSWDDSRHQRQIEEEFEKDWNGRAGRLVVMDVPEAARRNLLKYRPSKNQLPIRLAKRGVDCRKLDTILSFVWQAHQTKNGQMVGLMTAPVDPWPHQVGVFLRLYSDRPARLLLADEVGLGKTIQAGLFLRQAWLEGRQRILVMTPAGLTKQWQIELREKLNLDWPIYDGKCLIWQHIHAESGNRKESSDNWIGKGPVIMSSHLARRSGRADEIVAAEWDIVVLDEAHYARQTNPTNPDKHTPNRMLRLMRRLQEQTQDLILLTATPMQLHPVELYDLLALLGLPRKWNRSNFERFYDRVYDLGPNDLVFMREMFRTSCEKYGPIDVSQMSSSELWSKKAIQILEKDQKKRIVTGDYDVMAEALLQCSPVTRLVSRNTRRDLRRYITDSNSEWKLGTRKVSDHFITMSPAERIAYDGVDHYISNVWNTYKGPNRQAVGFALTIYKKRLASSFAALGKTLENHLGRLDNEISTPETGGYKEYKDMDVEDMDGIEPMTLKEIDRDAVMHILDMVRDLPVDSKFDRLVEIIAELRRHGYGQVMVFTQFTDTMDFLRAELRLKYNIMCYSGRGGEVPDLVDGWTPLGRDDVKKKFSDGSVDILLCTDAAAEGLNFQFCGAMINYDMPWNPMRVEQRIGRIDRIGQEHPSISIANMYYDDTIEADVYRALRKRIKLFEGVVGGLQPILDSEIMGDILTRDRSLLQKVDKTMSGSSLDLDRMLSAGTERYEPFESPVTMEDLDRVICGTGIMARYVVEPVGRRQYSIMAPNSAPVRVTTDRGLFENYGGSMEFWSPGSPAFPKPDAPSDPPRHATLKRLLDSME